MDNTTATEQTVLLIKFFIERFRNSLLANFLKHFEFDAPIGEVRDKHHHNTNHGCPILNAEGPGQSQ